MDRNPLTSKYALMELERRFLLSSLPNRLERPIRITDRYIRGTTLRLRKMEDVEGSAAPVFKLAQKVRLDRDDPSRVSLTNMYVTDNEYDLLATHRADVLEKMRYSLRVDERRVAVCDFEGALAGLILLEAEFGSEDEMAAFSPPSFVVREVSNDDRFSGGRLSHTSAAELGALLR